MKVMWSAGKWAEWYPDVLDEQGVLGTPQGRMPRAARAILALGMIRDRRATPVLAESVGTVHQRPGPPPADTSAWPPRRPAGRLVRCRT